ncbi:hypothetical protein TUM3792_02370 [Shewanella sp. MBTL60-007]|nr:hypothetical protein TUM3792_02370 [Shewanella sp. MBTL60-007]
MQIAKANEQIANTEKQILETQQKNRTDLYLAHYKHLSEHIIEIEKKWENASNQTVLMPGKSLTIDKKRCHRYLYPSSSLINGTGNISYRSFDYAVMTLVSILDKAIYLL